MIYNPFVSIIIPTFNRAELIKETLKSVEDQTYHNWECIVVDDESSDNSKEVILEFANKDSRFNYLSNQRRKGAPGARNTGIEIAKSDYLIFLDSDDLIAPNCVANRVHTFYEYSKCDFIVFSTLQFHNKIGDSDILINVPTKEQEDIIIRFLNFDVPWLTTGPIWKKKSLIALGCWNEEILSYQDWEMHLRAILRGFKYQHFSKIDNYWRVNEGTFSVGNDSEDYEHLKSHIKLMKDLKPYFKNKPRYIPLLNKLISWEGDRALKKGYKDLSIEALHIYREEFKIYETVINFIGIKLFGKVFFKLPFQPHFGTIRKVSFHDALKSVE